MLRKTPARMRQCMPTSVFSSEVIVPNRRMFWNVRPMPERGDLVLRQAGELAPVEQDLARRSACRRR